MKMFRLTHSDNGSSSGSSVQSFDDAICCSSGDEEATAETISPSTSISSVDFEMETKYRHHRSPPKSVSFAPPTTLECRKPMRRRESFSNESESAPIQKQEAEENAYPEDGLLPDNGLLQRTWEGVLDCPQRFYMSKNGSYSPESFKAFTTFSDVQSSPLVQLSLAILALVVVPLGFYGRFPGDSPWAFLKAIRTGWDALLHFSVTPIVLTTLPCALYCAFVKEQGHGFCSKKRDSTGVGSSRTCTSGRCRKMTPNFFAIVLIALYSLGISLTSQFQIIYPSWIWNPFLWGSFRIYRPSELQNASEGVCLDYVPGDISRQPLCLEEDSWRVLSAEALSSNDDGDVRDVMNGVSYFHKSDKGLIVNVMSRDTIEAIEPLRQNVEALSKFIPKVSVVVFENDSSDGSREAFKEWQNDSRGYKVDLIECEDAVDCRFGESHRYDATEAKDYFQSSAIGSMAKFRQRIVDYIMAKPEYTEYSHMVVIDLDLGISLSPLGILHSVGRKPDNPIVSSGRQVWPGSFGTLVPPYDFSAFRPTVTKENRYLVNLHRKFCELMPAGDRWRNQCDAVSPMHLIQVLTHDRSGSDMYQVDSAFNGGTLYPLDLIRETGATYDVGDDGQRCEHIGFNLGLKKPMYINPKWAMHISPTKPGGPTGARAMKNVARIVFTPRLSVIIFFQNVGCMFVLVYSFMALGMHILYPLTCRFVRCPLFNRTNSLPKHHESSRIPGNNSNEPFDFINHSFLSPSPVPKRKLSDSRVINHV